MQMGFGICDLCVLFSIFLEDDNFIVDDDDGQPINRGAKKRHGHFAVEDRYINILLKETPTFQQISTECI